MNTPHPADDADRRALDAVLARIDAGHAPADALAREPDDATRGRIAPLVAAALSLRTAPLGPLRPAFRSALQSTLAALEDEPPAGRRGPIAPWRPFAHAGPSRRRLALVLTTVLALVIAGIAYAVTRVDRIGGPSRSSIRGADSGLGGLGASGQPVIVSAPPVVVATLPGRAETAVAGLRAAARATSSSARDAAARRARVATPTAVAASGGVGAVEEGDAAAPPPDAATPPPPDAPPTHRSRPAASTTPSAQTTATTTATTTTATTATSTSAPAPGVAIAGAVTADGAPLAGVIVVAWRGASGSACAPGDLTASASASTDAQGRFAFADLPPGIYLVSAESGPLCLPRRWCAGAAEPAVDDPCAAARLALERAGDATGLANVAMAGGGAGCPLGGGGAPD
ncbi:MAG: carboxypeptidase-like regulatory domain-containing protein [Ardenticatenales bacterium]